MPTTAAAYPFVSTTGTYTYLTGGTQLTAYLAPGYTTFNTDDVYAQNVPIGFTFPYCGNTYTTLTISSNGWVCFRNLTINMLLNINSTASYGDAPFPGVFPLWDDLDGNGGPGSSSFMTTGTAPNRVFTMEWRDWEWNYTASASVISFQVKLYEQGLIECWYKQEAGTPTSATATIGIGGPTLVGQTFTDYQTLPNTSANPVPTSSSFIDNLGTKPATNQIYRWGQLPCTGTPTTSVVGPSQVCSGKPFTISLSGLSLFSGLTYQWQNSPDGTNWTNITGATNSSYTGTIYTPTWYRCTVTCTNSSQSYTTAGFYVAIAPFYYCYCDQTSLSQTGIDIGNLTVHTSPANDTVLNNGVVTTIENNTAANKGYTDFRYTVPPMAMYHDSTYKFTVKQINSGTFTAGMATIFIDYNRNGRFDDTERILLQPTINVLPNPGVVTGTYKLPDSARYGLTGMRVIIGSGNTAPDSCANTANGETEDYLVDLRYVPCTGAPLPGIVEGDTSMCIGYDYVLTDTTYQTKKHGIDRVWQISADTVSQVTIPGSLNKDTLARIFSGQPFYYRVLATCSHTNDTSASPWHRVNIKPNYKCYCHSQSSGTANDTSDIGAFTLSTLSTSDGGTHLLNPKAFRKRQDRTDMEPIVIDVDSIYNFSVFHTMPYQNHADGKVTVFVDFNNNKKYDIPEERIFMGFTSIGYHVLLNALVIPNNVIVDMPTGMRVIINNNVAPNIPSDEGCGEYISGETEDYIVKFKRSFPVGVKEAEGVNQLSLIPNPSSGKFQVQFKGAASQEGVTVRILNVTGQLVKQQVYQHNGGIFRQEIDLGNEAKGMYMVEVTSGGQKMIEKLTVR